MPTQDTPQSVSQFSSVMSDSLRPHEPQHARPPCPSPTPEVYPNSCPSSRWCHPAISSSVVPFSSCPQSLPASRSFPMSQLFTCSCYSVTKSCLTLCDSMDCLTPSFPALHYLPGFAQIHVHWVGDGISPSHSLMPSSLPALNISQHQGLFQ